MVPLVRKNLDGDYSIELVFIRCKEDFVRALIEDDNAFFLLGQSR